MTLTSSSNTYSGSTIIDSGTLELSDGVPSSAVSISSGAILSILGSSSSEVGSISGQGSILIPSSGSLSTGSDDTSTTFSGAISGAGDLEKFGSGVFTLEGSSPSFGPSSGVYVWSGELVAAHENAVGSDNDVFVENAVFSR